MFRRTTNLTVSILVLSIALFGLQACGGGSPKTNPTTTGTTTPVDTTAPTVQSVSAVGNNVDYTKEITVIFDDDINPNVSATDVTLQISGGADVSVSVRVSGAVLTITPTTALAPSTTYKLIINNTIKDVAGNSLSTIRYTFATAAQAAVDTIAPTVIPPLLGSALVDFTKPIVIIFSENIVAPANSVTLTKGGNPVAIDFGVTGTSLTVTPTVGNLVAASDYILTLKNTITDKASPANAFVEVSYSFTTTSAGNGGVVKTITFIELNDLHANLVPHTEMIRQTNAASGKKVLVSDSRGGLVRIAAKINDIRTNFPDSILMNIGDTYHGGAEAMFSVGNAIVPPVNALKIDIGVPGNWDFAYGPQVTNMRYGLIDKNNTLDPTVLRPNYTVLGGNAFYKTPTFDVTATADYQAAVVVANDPNSNFTDKRIPGAMATAITNLIAGINNDANGTPMTIPVAPAKPLQFLPATAIQVINGIKVGFIGLTSDIVFTMHPMMALNLDFTKGKDAYLKLINDYSVALKNDQNQPVDIVVVMSELGIHKDLALADALQGLKTNPTDRPAVDIFFSAHTHELIASNKQIKSASGALVVEAGNDTYLGQMDVGFDNNSVPVTFKWTIHAIDNLITPDLSIPYIDNVRILVESAQNPYLNVSTAKSIPQITLPGAPSIPFNPVTPQVLSHPLDFVVGNTDIPLDRKNALESNFNNAYTDLLRNSLGTDIAVTPGFRFDSAVMPTTPDYWEVENNVTLSGEITIADVYRFMPAAYFLATGTTTAQNLKKVLEGGLLKTFSSQAFDQEGGWMFGYSGLKIVVDLKQVTGQRVRKITAGTNNIYDASLAVSGNPANAFPSGPNFSLTIAGCGRPFDLPGRMCSMPGFTSVTAVTNPTTTSGIGPNASKYPASDFFIDNIGMLLSSSTKAISTRKDVTDSSNTLMWPDSEFVQPLRGVK